MTDVAPHCPRCGSNRMRDNREVRHSPKGPDYVCVESNCQGVVFPRYEAYADENLLVGYSENVFTVSGGVVTMVGDATRDSRGGQDAKDRLQREWIKKAVALKRHQRDAETMTVGIDEDER